MSLIQTSQTPNVNYTPAGTYPVQIEEFSEETSKAGNKMYRAVSRITADSDQAGALFYDYMVVGNEADPDAIQPATWASSRNFGATRLKKLLEAAGVAGDGEFDQLKLQLEGQVVEMTIDARPGNPKRGEDPKDINNNVKRYSSVGTNELGPAADIQTAQRPAAAAAPIAAPAGGGPAPQANGVQAPVAAPSSTVAEPAAAPVQPVPVTRSLT